LASIAVPIYNKQILKGRFEEAKVTMQAMALAQERYKIETGIYYPNSSEVIKNEKFIFNNLKVDLNKSNNFNYFVYSSSNEYNITATLRANNWEECTGSDTDNSDICKQSGARDIDEWVKGYTRGEKKHYIKFVYPPNSTGESLDYSNIHKDN
jgi:Tfp pilus assembly protein PilE